MTHGAGFLLSAGPREPQLIPQACSLYAGHDPQAASESGFAELLSQWPGSRDPSLAWDASGLPVPEVSGTQRQWLQHLAHSPEASSRLVGQADNLRAK